MIISKLDNGFINISEDKVQIGLEQILEVLKDPNSPNTSIQINAQYALGLKLNKAIKETTTHIEDIERKRRDVQKQMKDEKVPNKINDLRQFEDKLYQIESDLLDIKQTGARQDNFRNPVKALERFLAIAKESIVASGDNAPTDQQGQVYDIQNQVLERAKKAYQEVAKSAVFK